MQLEPELTRISRLLVADLIFIHGARSLPPWEKPISPGRNPASTQQNERLSNSDLLPPVFLFKALHSDRSSSLDMAPNIHKWQNESWWLRPYVNGEAYPFGNATGKFMARQQSEVLDAHTRLDVHVKEQREAHVGLHHKTWLPLHTNSYTASLASSARSFFSILQDSSFSTRTSRYAKLS